MKSWIIAIIFSISAYLIGSINFPYIFTKLRTKKDLYDLGTKNVGGFNAMLQTSTLIGGIAGFLDLMKGFGLILAAVLIQFDDSPLLNVEPNWQLSWHMIICILVVFFVALGHNFPIYLKFRGGRGLGIAIGVFWIINPVIIAIFVIPTLIFTFLTKYVRPGQFISLLIIMPTSFFIPIYPPWIPEVLHSQLMLGLLTLGLSIVMLPKYAMDFVQMFKGKEYKVGKNQLIFQNNEQKKK